jgi:hypothetical protein
MVGDLPMKKNFGITDNGAYQGGEARAADRQDGAKRHFAYR